MTEPAAIADTIAAARKRGHSIMEQGCEEGVFSAAAAILGADGYAIAALARAAPLGRTSKAAATERGNGVAAAARDITQQLNGAGFDTLTSRASA
jgi:DNA-binding IclR family transcriptional regulator